MSINNLRRGDVVDVDLSGAIDGEKLNDPRTGSRPCVIVQNNQGNEVSPLTQIVPLNDARQYKGYPVQVLLEQSELLIDGAKRSSAECGHIRTIKKTRIKNHRGRVAPAAMIRVDDALRASLAL